VLHIFYTCNVVLREELLMQPAHPAFSCHSILLPNICTLAPSRIFMPLNFSAFLTISLSMVKEKTNQKKNTKIPWHSCWSQKCCLHTIGSHQATSIVLGKSANTSCYIWQTFHVVRTNFFLLMCANTFVFLSW
jgi:hypothetical protein